MTKQITYVAVAVLAMVSLLVSGCASRPTREPSSQLATKAESPPPTPTPGQSPMIPSDTGAPRTPPSTQAIPWTEVEELILNGDVWKVTQGHDLEVTLYLIDGREVKAIEPRLDDIFQIIEQCGEACSEIQQITE